MQNKHVEQILMERDGDTKELAEARIAEVVDLFEECNYDYDECECILMDYLGLEMDYIHDIV